MRHLTKWSCVDRHERMKADEKRSERRTLRRRFRQGPRLYMVWSCPLAERS